MAIRSTALISRDLPVRSQRKPAAGTIKKEKIPEAEMIKDISLPVFPMPVRYTDKMETKEAMAKYAQK